MIVECVETAERIEAVLPEIDEMMDGGLITLEKANVITYRGRRNSGEDSGSTSV